jgi:MSHA biogenesis protein MshM
MYLEHFGLKEHPFGITPDTSFFFSAIGYQEALNTLLIAARTGEGFIKITGEVGTGKTLLCRKFMASLEDDFKTAYVPNPYLEPNSLLLVLTEELGLRDVNAPEESSQHQLLKLLTQGLLDYAREGKRVVVCMDEVQAMPTETLEALRLLTNLETEKRKLLQVVIFGQPELEDKLNQPSIRQLKQRVTFEYHLGALSPDDLNYYLSHRLAVAGHQGGRLFSRLASKVLHFKSGGVPRLVNILAHKAMLRAFGKGRRQVGVLDVLAASADTASTRGSASAKWLLLLMVLGCAAVVATWVVLK